MTPEPPPRGTIGTPCSDANRRVAATSASSTGRTTAAGSTGAPHAQPVARATTNREHSVLVPEGRWRHRQPRCKVLG